MILLIALGALTQLVWARGMCLWFSLSLGHVYLIGIITALGLPLERPKCKLLHVLHEVC